MCINQAYNSARPPKQRARKCEQLEPEDSKLLASLILRELYGKEDTFSSRRFGTESINEMLHQKMPPPRDMLDIVF